MKKVKYDYIPPFGTDIQILEVMSKTTSNKLNKAMGKIKTVNGMFGGALANLRRSRGAVLADDPRKHRGDSPHHPEWDLRRPCREPVGFPRTRNQ